jgi:competence protein ComFC
MKAVPLWRNVLALVEDYLFPMHCAACGKPVSVIEDGVCEGCLGEIVPVKDGCPRCSGLVREDRCEICSDRMWYLDRCITAAEYTGSMKDMLRSFKFEKKRRIHRHLCEITYNALQGESLDADVVTSVPMTGAKVWKRGFNQSELVARGLAGRLGCEYRDLLEEKGSSRTQKDLQYRDRFINILGRYAPRRAEMRGRKVLVVDDVFTTGATLNECARVLRDAGAVKVFAVTIARRTLAE